MRILGIDPGVATVGFGVIDSEGGRAADGPVRRHYHPGGYAAGARLVQIGGDLEQLIRQFQPDEMSIEELFFSKNITTGIAVAHGRGVLLYTAEKLHLPVYEYTPMQIKQAVVGYGLAEKRQVMDMTRRLLKLKAVPRPDDAADALAIAICHARSATSLLPAKGPRCKGDGLNMFYYLNGTVAGDRRPVWPSSTAAAWAMPAPPQTIPCLS